MRLAKMNSIVCSRRAEDRGRALKNTGRKIRSCLCFFMMAALLLNAAPSPARAKTSPAGKPSIRAIVRPGDSLWKMARRYRPGQNPVAVVEAMRQANRLGKYIHPGQEIIIPDIGGPSSQASRNNRFVAKAPARGGENRVLTCEATAYCPTGYHTATGTWPAEGRTIAVDPNVIPLNSKVRVTCETWPEINGIYMAEDTGGAVKGQIIDIFMNERDQALRWGRRNVTVETVQ